MLISTIWRLLMNYTVGQFPICQMRCETSKKVPAETITSNDIETLYKGKMKTLEGNLHRRLDPPFDYLLRLYPTSFLDQINTKYHNRCEHRTNASPHIR
ncbi:hypothetical protein ANTRET_LOCUS6553 [Anthophora retusa]